MHKDSSSDVSSIQIKGHGDPCFSIGSRQASSLVHGSEAARTFASIASISDAQASRWMDAAITWIHSKTEQKLIEAMHNVGLSPRQS